MLLAASAASLALLTFAQPETLAPENRQRFSLTDTISATKRLMTDRGFLSLTFLGGFAMASFFVFLASAAFVYTTSFGLSPTGFSLAFAANAVAFIGASQAAGPLGAKLGAMPLMRLATMGFALAACSLFALSLAGLVNLWVCMIGLGLGTPASD